MRAARSRSPTQPLGKRDSSALQLPPDRVDHRHRLGLGTRLSLGPFNPLPVPALSPRTNSRLLSPPPPACVGPPLPKPKHRAVFYAKHHRAPSRNPSVLAVAMPSCKLSGVPSAAGSTSPVGLQAFSQPFKQVPAVSGSGLKLQQSVHHGQFEEAMQVWQAVKPLLLPFSVVLQDLEHSSHAGELEVGLLRTVSEVTALRYLRVLLKFLQQLDELWQLSWDMASQAVGLGASLRQAAPGIVSFALEAGQLPGACTYFPDFASTGASSCGGRFSLRLRLIALVRLAASSLGVYDVLILLSARPGVQDKDFARWHASGLPHFRGVRFGLTGSPNLARTLSRDPCWGLAGDACCIWAVGLSRLLVVYMA